MHIAWLLLIITLSYIFINAGYDKLLFRLTRHWIMCPVTQMPIIVPEKEVYCETFVDCCAYAGSDERAIDIIVNQGTNILYRAKVNMPVCKLKISHRTSYEKISRPLSSNNTMFLNIFSYKYKMFFTDNFQINNEELNDTSESYNNRWTQSSLFQNKYKIW